MICIVDIEKRKSFADMKLAEVAAGGQQWTFENLPEEPSTPCDEAEEIVPEQNGDHENSTEATEDMHCNGHDEKNGTNNGELTAAAENIEDKDNGSEAQIRSPILASATAENKLDPVTELAPGLQVKIADLGNACWVVSLLKMQ